jgi:cysteine-rich repeat protein
VEGQENPYGIEECDDGNDVDGCDTECSKENP